MVQCVNCSKTAVAQVGGAPLCVDCYAKLQNAELQRQQGFAIQQSFNMAMMNHALAEMDAITGFASTRVQIPAVPGTTVNQGPITLNNIKVDRSTIGVVNTGNVNRIDAGLDRIKSSPAGEDLAVMLAAVTEAVLQFRGDDNLQKDALDKLSFLVTQAATPANQRQPGVIHAVLSAMPQVFATITGAAEAWEKVQPILHSLFQ